MIAKVRANFDEVKLLDPDIKQGVMDSYMIALVAVFGTTFAMSVLAALASLFMRENKLHANISRR
jgi:hypothetical protein